MDYEQLAEAHQRVADAHAHLAGLLQGRCVQPTFLIPDVAPQQPEKLSAPSERSVSPSWFWRQVLTTYAPSLKAHFGDRAFRVKELRAFLSPRVELLPGDTEKCGNSLRWHKNLDNAMTSTHPGHWPSGTPVVTRSTGPDQWIIT